MQVYDEKPNENTLDRRITFEFRTYPDMYRGRERSFLWGNFTI